LVGSNRRASLLTGLNINLVIISTYIFAGIVGALAGLVLAGNVGSAQIGMAKDYTLLSIAAVVIGGTKLSGGSGTYFGTALGSVVLVILYS
jgi:ribose transport system permease protein